VFRGRFQHNVDAKGRVSFPARFREILANNYEDRLVLIKYLRCLRAYPLTEWISFEKSVSARPLSLAQETLLRSIMASVAECPLDKQGRILIPQELRDFAGLSKEVVLVGMLKRIEIWDRARFEEQDAQVLESEEAAEVATQLGL